MVCGRNCGKKARKKAKFWDLGRWSAYRSPQYASGFQVPVFPRGRGSRYPSKRSRPYRKGTSHRKLLWPETKALVLKIADRPKITVVAAGIIPRVQPKAADTLVRNPWLRPIARLYSTPVPGTTMTSRLVKRNSRHIVSILSVFEHRGILSDLKSKLSTHCCRWN